jgi:hypothetical protein
MHQSKKKRKGAGSPRRIHGPSIKVQFLNFQKKIRLDGIEPSLIP